MGYRSEVVIKVHESLILPFAVVMSTEKAGLCLRELASTYEKTLAVFDNIKWYSGDPHVDVMMDWLDTLDGELYGFIRVGEEHGDTDSLGEPYNYDMFIETQISY